MSETTSIEVLKMAAMERRKWAKDYDATGYEWDARAAIQRRSEADLIEASIEVLRRQS